MKKTNLFASVLNSLGEFMDEASELTLNFARNTTSDLGECLLGLTETAFECIDDLIETAGDTIGIRWDGDPEYTIEFDQKIANAPVVDIDDTEEPNWEGESK